jgi:hypothetical protein
MQFERCFGGNEFKRKGFMCARAHAEECLVAKRKTLARVVLRT